MSITESGVARSDHESDADGWHRRLKTGHPEMEVVRALNADWAVGTFAP